MTFDEYSTCVTGLMSYVIVGNELEGPIFHINTIGAATRYGEVFPEYLALDSQTELLFTSRTIDIDASP